MDIENSIRSTIRNIPDFPKPGINFKDITPLLQDVELSRAITQSLASYWQDRGVEAVVGIESRGFIWGNSLAQQMSLPFIPVRKKGKLPADTYEHTYELEYGSATVEIHKDAFSQGCKVLVHDDLLATGGTAVAAAELVQQVGGQVAGFSFLVELDFLKGRDLLQSYRSHVRSLVHY